MAYDLTTFTEVDIGADRLSVTSSTVTMSDVDRDESVYLHTSESIAADFSIDFTINVNSTSSLNSLGAAVGVSQTLKTLNLSNADSTGICVLIQEVSTGTNIGLCADNVIQYAAPADFALDTNWYGTLSQVGTGLALDLYSDSGRTSLVESITATTTVLTYSYLLVGSGWNDGNTGRAFDATVSDVTLDVPVTTPATVQSWEAPLQISRMSRG